MRQPDVTKKLVYATLTYNDSFSNCIKFFLDDIDVKIVDKFDIFMNQNVKSLFYKFNDYLLFRILPTVRVKHSKIVKNEIILKETQNRDLQYLVESVRTTKTAGKK